MELGNLIFGHSRGQFPVPRDAGWEECFRELLEAIDGPGCDGYGTEFICDVFEIHRYHWGDCPCGFQQAEETWLNTHHHTDSCYQHRFTDEVTHHSAIALHPTPAGHPISPPEPNVPEATTAHCTCGYDEAYAQWAQTHHHLSTCPIVRPNFQYAPSQFSLMWYKYPFRDAYMSHPLALDEFRSLIHTCIQWIQQHQSVGLTTASNG
jgi:hypothetical protein